LTSKILNDSIAVKHLVLFFSGDWATQEPGEANNQNLDEIEDFVDGNPPGVAELNPSGDM